MEIVTHAHMLGLAFGTFAIASTAHATLSMYDAAVAADHAAALQHTAVPTSPVSVDTTAGVAFDFGAVSGFSTIEFIISGDPVA